MVTRVEKPFIKKNSLTFVKATALQIEDKNIVIVIQNWRVVSF